MDINIDESIDKNREMIEGIKRRIFENKGKYYGYEDLYFSKNEEIRNYINIITVLFDFEKISASRLLSGIKLSEKDIDKIILGYLFLYQDKNLERTNNVLVNGILIKSMIEAYKEVRETFIKNNKETLYLNMEEMEEKIVSLESKNHELNEKNIEFDKKILLLTENKEKQSNNLRKTYEKQISQLNKKLNEMDKQLTLEKKKATELIKLREMFFEIKSDHDIIESKNTIHNFTKDKKILIVGGTTEWRKKIKEKYNEILTLDGFNENFDISILNSIDHVFFYAGHMNHATYYRIINYVRNKEIPFGYIGKTNIELIENEIVENLEKSFRENY